MRRPIKFKGMSPNKVWYYGSLICKEEGNCQIYTEEGYRFDVLDDTICQYTGINDAYETELYEKDYVKDDNFVYKIEYNTNQTAYKLNAILSLKNESDILLMITYDNLGNGYLKRRDLVYVSNEEFKSLKDGQK